VLHGVFGLGELENDQTKCIFYKEDCTLSLSGTEIIIREELCDKKDKPSEPIPEPPTKPPIKDGEPDLPETPTKELLKIVHLNFKIPKGKVSSIMGMMNLLQSKFDEITIDLKAEKGELSKDDYENKIKEALRQIGVNPED